MHKMQTCQFLHGEVVVSSQINKLLELFVLYIIMTLLSLFVEL